MTLRNIGLNIYKLQLLGSKFSYIIFNALGGLFVKSKKAEMKTMADKKNIVPGMLNDNEIHTYVSDGAEFSSLKLVLYLPQHHQLVHYNPASFALSTLGSNLLSCLLIMPSIRLDAHHMR